MYGYSKTGKDREPVDKIFPPYDLEIMKKTVNIYDRMVDKKSISHKKIIFSKNANDNPEKSKMRIINQLKSKKN